MDAGGDRAGKEFARLSRFFVGIDAAFDLGHSLSVPNNHHCDNHRGDRDNGDGTYARTEYFGTQHLVEPV